MKNMEVLRRMGKYTGITCASTASDDPMSYGGFIDAQVLFATHGRLKKWFQRRAVSFDGVKMLVLDEADQMLDEVGLRGVCARNRQWRACC